MATEPQTHGVKFVSESLTYIENSLRSLAVPIEGIKADPNNVRQHSLENLNAIKRSLQAFGQQKPIVVTADNVCLAGNGTLSAARALGWTHLAVVQSGLVGRGARAFAIADNRTTDLSQWDDHKLAEQLAELQNDLDLDHLATGFDDDQIEKMIDEAVGNTSDVDGPEVDITDTYQLLVACEDENDQHQLYDHLKQEGYTCRVLTL